MMIYEKGFTLIEFLMAVLIAAIFVSFVVPSYYRLIQNNKTITVANKLSSTFSMARAEAIKRGQLVAVCSSANASNSSCGSEGNWNQGWMVFLDIDNNSNINTNSDLLYINQSVADGVTITANVANVSYNGVGFLSTGSAQFIIRADNCTGNNGRIVDVSTNGRVSIRQTNC